MEKIKLDINSVLKFVSEKEIRQIESEEATKAIDMVKNGTGEGNDFLGWYDLPSRTSMKELDEIIEVANDLRNSCEYVVSQQASAFQTVFRFQLVFRIRLVFRLRMVLLRLVRCIRRGTRHL